MHKSVVIRVVPPPAVKIPLTTAILRIREWDVEKLLDHLRESLEPRIHAELGEDVEVQVVAGRQSEIRLNNVKPRGGVVEWKEALGEAIGETMSEIDPEMFLAP
ncbi:hypothetical protein DAETH_32950 (plasmid) [Deinococcus aetherius]|uniref:Uncharacterized protein n=1 Tax=Deinococcus aetherius TaxID=200252 RepID=A0ABM8AHT4_9DEIO|nr:hypothetical protein [Deinococcus aetherius]BDP43326.1 hypothetical protein DAETH_32950 [Deinococcus aetherius]